MLSTDVQLSKNFWMNEFLRSRTAVIHGISMTPSQQVINSYEWGAGAVLQPLRDSIGSLVPSSGYRPAELNTKIGGSLASFHQSNNPGQGAVDLTATKVDLRGLMDALLRLNVPFRKAILEFNQWVHISWDANQNPPMQRALSVSMVEGKRVYVRYG